MDRLDCKTFKEMFTSGANNLENKHEEVNSLNVFPVPDGDTGTNMSMTFTTGINEMNNLMNDHVGDSAKVLAKNMLMGARGNSGVILSQIFKGIQKSLDGKDVATTEDIVNAFSNGAVVAYKAVMTPVEGTILTVVRESSEAGRVYFQQKPNASIEEYFNVVYQQAQKSLKNTPELLPVLKEAGVVDSGGAGYTAVLEGVVSYLNGKPIGVSENKAETVEKGYCIEVEIQLSEKYQKEFDPAILNKSLAKSSNVLDISRNEKVATIHVHTLNPGVILSICQKFGEMDQVKVANLAKGHESILEPVVSEEVEYEFITVCNGKGIAEEFKTLGVNHVINGGQTMNPATEDFVEIIKKINAKTIFILPNNGNIILAAQQAKEVMSDHNIVVLASKTIPEGLAACIAFNCEESIENNIENMNEAMANVTTGEVTTAVKDTTYNKLKINNGDYMGICGKEILVSTNDLLNTTKQLLDRIIDDNKVYVTLIYGQDIGEDIANEIKDFILEKYDVDCGIINGNQELYPFIIGVE